MQSDKYLSSYGWKGHGNPLSENGLVHPILIKHKKDRKGIGLVNNLDQKDKWWETMFDNNLKNLNTELDTNTGEIVMTKLQKDEEVFQNIKKSTSILYTSMFVKGRGLKGTIGEKIIEDQKTPQIVSRALKSDRKKSKKDKKEGKQDKKERKRLKLKIKIEKKQLKEKKLQKKTEKKAKKDEKRAKKNQAKKEKKEDKKERKSKNKD